MPILSRRLCLALAALSLTPAAHAADADAQVIVKLRAESPLLLKRAQSGERSQAFTSLAGFQVKAVGQPSTQTQVLKASGMTSQALAEKLRALPDVEYAVPDGIKHIRALPSDPLFGSQWYLQATQPAALNAVAAWDLTTGLAAVTVAVLDTGIRPDHPDLATKLVSGFDFVSEITRSNDGDGWDSDPTDPGDYVTAAELTQPAFSGCGAGPNADQPTASTWHGTKVAGIIAAASNNALGVAGVSWGSQLQPVRVMGKCGGRDSDIIAAMRWAAGLPVPGVPANATPAKVLNLSLGAAGTCSQPYKDAIAEITARGVVIVAAAGNETGPVDEPGDCPGVLAVAGVRHNGVKVGYSSFGTEVGISAPAGNCVNSTGPCLYPIVTTTNQGVTTPGANSYTGPTEVNVGTSFAVPQASGVAALMFSANPALATSQLIGRMKRSAHAFTVDSSLPTCPVVGATGTDAEGQCNCTTTTCGAGLLNAYGAVLEANKPIASITGSGSGTVGAKLVLDGSGSAAASGHQVAQYAWSVSPAGGSVATLDQTAASSVTLTLTGSGTAVVNLTVTDDAGAQDTSTATITVSGGSGSNTGGSSSGNTSGGSTSSGSSGGGGGGGGCTTGRGDQPLDLALPGLLALACLGLRRARRLR